MRPPPVGGGYTGFCRPSSAAVMSFNEAAARGRRIRAAFSSNIDFSFDASMRPPPVGGGYNTQLPHDDDPGPGFNEAAARGRRILPGRLGVARELFVLQ